MIIIETAQGRAKVTFYPNGTTGLVGSRERDPADVKPGEGRYEVSPEGTRQWFLMVEVGGVPVVWLSAISGKKHLTSMLGHMSLAQALVKLVELFGERETNAWLAALRAVVA